MEVYLNICPEYKDKQVKRCVGLVHESVENNGLFQNEIPNAVESHLKEINVLLQSGKTRCQGFQLLLPLIQQGSQDLIEKRCDIWLNACIQAITTFCGASDKIQACQIIILLLKASPNLPELQKILLSKSPAALIQNLATANSSWSFAALECLYEFIKLFPGPSLAQKVVLEENMLKYLDHPLAKVSQDDIVKKAGQVYAAIPLPGMGGNKSQGKAEARGLQVTQLMALAHETMDMLFEGVVEKEIHKHTREYTLKISPIQAQGTSADAVRGFLMAVTRLGNIFKFISQILTSDSNESILLVPYYVLGPLFRVLQVDASVLKLYRSQEHQLLAFLIPSLHQHCLVVLRDLILSIGEGLDVYFGVIADLLTAVIKMSFTNEKTAWCTSGFQTRIIAYSVLSSVVQISRGRHSPPSELVTLLLQDTTPKSQHITLQKVQGKGLASLNVQKTKKKKGYLITKTDVGTQAGPFFQGELLTRITRAALSLAEILYTYASHSLAHKLKKMLQTSIMSIAGTVTGGAKLPEAYNDGRTRAQLFKTLASIGTHPDPRCPPPYTMILHILQQGQQDQQMIVVATCQALIGNLSFILANPQISEIALLCQQSKFPNAGDAEEESTDNVPLQENSERIAAVQQESESDEEEQMDEDEEEEEYVEPRQKSETTPGSKVQENGEHESDAESDADDDNEELMNEVEDIKKNGNYSNTKKNDADSKKLNSVETSKVKGLNGDKSEKEVPKSSQPTPKRKIEVNTAPSRKMLRKDTNETGDGPSLEEMLNSFVDAEPDDE